LRQICNLIPEHLGPKIARQTKVDEQARTFKPWSHGVARLDAQGSHSLSLKDVCDGLQWRSGPLSALRGATPPSGNGFSHANRQRPPEMAQQLFGPVLEHLKQQSPGFGAGRRRKAAAKTHLRLNFQSLLPECVIVDTAAQHDNERARELCAHLRPGEIVVFDKA